MAYDTQHHSLTEFPGRTDDFNPTMEAKWKGNQARGGYDENKEKDRYKNSFYLNKYTHGRHCI